MKQAGIITLTAIVAIVALEMVALCKGINGVLLGGAITIIAGLGGYQVHNLRDKLKHK